MAFNSSAAATFVSVFIVLFFVFLDHEIAMLSHTRDVFWWIWC